MRFSLGLLVLLMGGLLLFGPSVQAQDTSQPSPADKESYIEKSSQELPLRKESVIPQGTMIRVAVAIVIGLILAVAIAYFIKRYIFMRNTLGTSEHSMQLLEMKRLSPRLMLFRVRVAGKTIVLAQSGERLIELDPTKAFNTIQEADDDEA
jgi:flagellar biogenesis protein FliO